MIKRVYEFLEKYKCIFGLQFAFRNKHSTSHALIDIAETIRNALDNKKIVVGFDSVIKYIKHGVPRRSVLGPLLFSIYINNLRKAIKYSEIYHFADDTNLLIVSKSPSQLEPALEANWI